jgi:hypothetical protein
MLYIKNYIYYFVINPQYSKSWKNNSVSWKLAIKTGGNMLIGQDGVFNLGKAPFLQGIFKRFILRKPAK